MIIIKTIFYCSTFNNLSQLGFYYSIVLFVLFNPNRQFVQRATRIEDCQQILRLAKTDILRIHSDMEMDKEVQSREKTLYRYYCEAILVFRHVQCPRAVEALMVSSSFLMSLYV